jgi:hypothetical protein
LGVERSWQADGDTLAWLEWWAVAGAACLAVGRVLTALAEALVWGRADTDTRPGMLVGRLALSALEVALARRLLLPLVMVGLVLWLVRIWAVVLGLALALARMLMVVATEAAVVCGVRLKLGVELIERGSCRVDGAGWAATAAAVGHGELRALRTAKHGANQHGWAAAACWPWVLC